MKKISQSGGAHWVTCTAGYFQVCNTGIEVLSNSAENTTAYNFYLSNKIQRVYHYRSLLTSYSLQNLVYEVMALM